MSSRLDKQPARSEEIKPDNEPSSGLTNGIEVEDKNNNNSNNNTGSSIDDAQALATSSEGPPDDIRAFYGHPLVSASANEEEDTHASAVALLHEYINLPALDKSGMKIGDKINSIYDIMRDDGSSSKVGEPSSSPELDNEYMKLLQTTLASDVDKFFIREGCEDTIASISPSNKCPVSLAEEVIAEISVQSVCLPSKDQVQGDTFPQLHVEHNVVTSTPTTIANHDTNLSMPDIHGIDDITTTTFCDVTSHFDDGGSQMAAVENGRPHMATIERGAPQMEVARQTSSAPSKRIREQKHNGVEKSQELSKKLVKALTEKIMKRKNLQSDQNNMCSTSNKPVECVASTDTTCIATPVDVVDSFIEVPTDISNKLSSFSSKHDHLLGELEQSLNIVTEPNQISNKDTLVTHAIQSSYSSVHTDSNAMTPLESFVHAETNPESAGLTQNQALSHSSMSSIKQQTSQTNVYPVSVVQNVNVDHISKHPQFIRTTSVPVVSNINSFYEDSTNCVPVDGAVPQVNGNLVAQAITPCVYPNFNMGYLYPPIRPTSSGSEERDVMLQRYIQQQNQFIQDHPNLHYSGPRKDTCGMKSPDSGFNEACVSPADRGVVYKDGGEQGVTDSVVEDEQGGKVSKRRRSAPAMYVRQYWTPQDKSKSTINKLECDPAGYTYFLETPISTNQRIEEDRITYLNKGQYYGLTLEHRADRPPKTQMVKSIIMVVFREDKHLGDERKAWEFWHSRQHSYKQRVIDIDTKNSVGVVPSSIEEISYNAVAVKWNHKDSPVKVNVAVHCLSTDFSNQKGVKGLPLHILIDTYDNVKDQYPTSRGYCQIKVFCDKGAERKTRDEERRKQCRVKTETKPAVVKAGRKRREEVFHPSVDRSEFYTMSDLQSTPVLFSPTFEGDDAIRSSPINLTTQDEDGISSTACSSDQYDSTEDSMYVAKRARTEAYPLVTSYSNILLYVREKHEVVFTAVMLRSPTLLGLLQAVEQKYNIPATNIKNSYKRSRKGILVRMDDNIIRHYSHESTFIIELNRINDGQDFELILTELDTS